MRRLISFALGVLTSALLIVLGLAWRGGTSSDAPSFRAKERFRSSSPMASDTPSKPLSTGSLAARTHILAGMADALALDELAGRAVNIYEELKKGDTRWQATVLRLSDLGYQRDERLQCAATHALPLHAECRGTIEMVLDPDAGVEAKVLYARAHTSTSEPDDAASCAAYVDCLAESRVGSMVPVPPDSSELVAIRQDTIYEWTSPAMFDPSKVEELIDLREEALADALARGALSEFDRLSEEQLVSYLHQHLAELREEARPIP